MREQRLVVSTIIVLILALWLAADSANAGEETAIEQMRQVIAERGYTFDVAENPATQYNIDEITGLVVPPGWWRTARTAGRSWSRSRRTRAPPSIRPWPRLPTPGPSLSTRKGPPWPTVGSWTRSGGSTSHRSTAPIPEPG